jgi:hypothetical protein
LVLAAEKIVPPGRERHYGRRVRVQRRRREPQVLHRSLGARSQRREIDRRRNVRKARIERIGPEQVVAVFARISAHERSATCERREIVRVTRVVRSEKRARKVRGEARLRDVARLPPARGRVDDRVPRGFEERLAIVVPDGLKDSENVRVLAFVREAFDVAERRVEIGIDLIPVEGARGDHLVEPAARDAVDVGRVRRFGTVVPVHEHERLRQFAEEFGMARDRVVPNHRPRAALRDDEVRRRNHVPSVHGSVAFRRHERLRRAAAEIRRLVGPDVKERRMGNRRELVRDQIANVRFPVGIGGREQIAVRQFGERRVALQLQRLVHVRERLLLRHECDVPAARVGVERAQLIRRDAVERRGQRMLRVDEHVLDVRRVAVHFECRDRSDALLKVPHRRQGAA